MYKEFFGLDKLPFNLTPDPSFLFLPPKHREALASLTYAIQARKGFVVLTGDAGTGKTTLLGSLLRQLPPGQIKSSVILNPTLTPAEFLELVLLDFGIADVPASKAQRLWRLQTLLLEAHRERKAAILVIDEAHKLSLDLLEEIRLLGNFEYGSDKFLQILLLGQCELDDLLNRHDLRQFKQRVALRLYIDPLGAAEIEEYIRFRWMKAGGTVAPPFSPEAMKGVVQWSQGIPRLINSLCDTALLMAYGEMKSPVGIEHVWASATNLALVEVSPPGVPPLGVPPLGVPPPGVPSPGVPPQAAKSAPLKLVPLEVAPELKPALALQDPGNNTPRMAPYDDPRVNSSLLRRLAGKFGFPG